MANIEDVTAASYLEGLQDWTLDQVRSRRGEATEVETGLSYVRRIVQGRLDIVLAEQKSRREGDEHGTLEDLVGHLPQILGDRVHAPGLGRLPALIGPGELDAELEQRLEAVLPASALDSLTELDDQKLASISQGLEELEHQVSSQRRAVFEVLDRLEEELVRRYRTGETNVDSLLP